jgi:hypothetical protein
MTRKLLAAAGISAVFALRPVPAWAADSAKPQPVSPDHDTPNVERHWYGWPAVALDAGALLATVSSAMVESDAFGGVAFGTGVALYGLGAPIVHLAHERPGIAVASLGLRASAVFVPLVLIPSDGRCPADNEYDDSKYCQPRAKKLLLIGGASILAAMIVDDAVLAWEERAEPAGAAIQPIVGWDGEGAFVGAQGAF